MKKKIQLILNKDHSNIGKKDTIVKVARGYAFNYLIPNEIAEIATKNKIKHLNMLQIIQNNKFQENKIKVQQLEKNITLINKLSILKKIGDEQYIFGTITEKDIIEKIFISTNIKLNKKQIKIPTIKKIGKFKIEINLSYNISLQLQLNIIPINI